jgi:phosphoadenosine phosphosulfate reductase
VNENRINSVHKFHKTKRVQNELFPIFLKLDHLHTLIVGAGNVGLEKLSAILANSPKAKITIVAPIVKDEILELQKQHEFIHIIQEKYHTKYLENKQLVLVATDDKDLNKQVKADAFMANILCNVADTPAQCDFYLGSIVQKGSLKLGISTNGKSPTVAKRIKEVLNEALPETELEQLLDNIGEIRKSLTGDFQQKIIELNKVTQSLVLNKKPSNMTENMIPELEKETAGMDLPSTLKFLSEKYSSQVAFSTSLGQEDQVISHIIFKNNIDIRVFTLDTGRLFQETYELLDTTRTRYKKNIEVYFPDAPSVQNLVNTKGMNSFYESVENRKECCFIRKVEPLNRALTGVSIWITGLRAEQSEGRSELSAFEFDAARNIVKYNPLVNWHYDDVLAYLKENKIPDNPLHRKGFVSIGCQPCTRAIMEGEHPRAGRWWWEESKKECGLHSN